VPPIYQPEVAADAVVWAARHYRREWYVGMSTAVAVAGNKLAPSLGDHYLGRHGYESQQIRKASQASPAPASAKRPRHKTKRGKQKSGKGGKAKSRKQAIAIGLSKARKKGAKVPKKKS